VLLLKALQTPILTTADVLAMTERTAARVVTEIYILDQERYLLGLRKIKDKVRVVRLTWRE